MEEDSFDDGENNYGSGKSDSLSFNSILMRHLERITRLASVEFRGGYNQQKTIPVAGTLMQQDIYVPDTRECYINAIENLSDLLLPNFDAEMTKDEEDCFAEIEKIKETIKDYDEFKDEKRKIIRKLFRSISKFLNRKNYLEMGAYEDFS